MRDTLLIVVGAHSSDDLLQRRDSTTSPLAWTIRTESAEPRNQGIQRQPLPLVAQGRLIPPRHIATPRRRLRSSRGSTYRWSARRRQASCTSYDRSCGDAGATDGV